MVVQFRGKQYRVHKLVIEAFIKNKLGLPTTDHKNRVRDDNRLENLRFGSYKLQADNTANVINRRDYGVRYCDDSNTYSREWRAKQRALGRRERRCPDGVRRFLTDEEYNARFGSSQQIPLF